MTRVLLITNTTDFTTDYVVRSLKLLCADFYRLNTDEIGSKVFLSFDFVHDEYILWDKPKKQIFDILSFTSVYFRRPVPPTVEEEDISADEKQFISIETRQTLEGLYKILRDVYWISDIDAIRKAENKIYQQLVAKEVGFKTPDSLITNFPKVFTSFVQNHTDCVVKSIYSGQIGWPEMNRVVFTSKLNRSHTAKQIELCPTYLQEQIKKKFDVRVTVVGEEIFAARIDSQSNQETLVDWRVGENNLPHTTVILPDNLCKQCIELLRRLDLRFGAIDFIETLKGEYVFLEINPNGQWAWIETQTGMPIADAIAKQLISKYVS